MSARPCCRSSDRCADEDVEALRVEARAVLWSLVIGALLVVGSFAATAYVFVRVAMWALS